MPTATFLAAADLLAPSTWEPEGRPPLLPHQIPPPLPWDLWLLEGGRGSGKTEACSRYFARYMREHPGARGRIIAPTNGDAVEACVRGPSGLLSIDPEIRFVGASAGGGKCFWPNGSEALVIGTAAPRDVERLRAGGNRDLDWWDDWRGHHAAQPSRCDSPDCCLRQGSADQREDRSQLGERELPRQPVVVLGLLPRRRQSLNRARVHVPLEPGVIALDNRRV